MEFGTGDPHTDYLQGMGATASSLAAASRTDPIDSADFLAANATARTTYGIARRARIATSIMHEMGVINEETAKAIAMAAAGAQAGRAVFGIIRALIGLRKAARAGQLSLAAAETTAAAIAQNWHGIALATGAAVGIAAAFKVGEYAGELGRPKEVSYVMGRARGDALA